MKFLVVDLFCGAGGTTTGFEKAVDENGNRVAKVIACVNHDPKAIESHWKNHPEVIHFEEDIRTLDLTELISIVKIQRALHPEAKLILWASLECTNFSKAKGGQPRDADSRTLADHLERYIIAISPDYVQIENVVEFMAWGPLDAKGKPVSSKNGVDWLRWRKEICALGYNDDWKELNSADFGAYTSRNRLFGVFAKIGLPYTWPEPTHSKTPSKGTLFSTLKKWKAVKEVLDLEHTGESIFNRKKPLVDNTLERIYAGMIKFVAGMNQKEFISKYYSGNPSDKNISIEGPAGTITTIDSQALVQMNFLMYYNGKDAKTGIMRSASSVEDPSRTITAQRSPNLVYLSNYYGSGSNVKSIEGPSNTIIGADVHAITFLDPLPVKWIDRQFGNGTKYSSIENPIGTILSVPKMSLVSADRDHGFIMNPGWIKGNNSSIENPCPVIIARQDKTPLYLIKMESAGSMAIPIYADDSEVMIRIKEFMVLFGIADIKMRMLSVNELLRIQGFPKGYHLSGNQSDQKKFIGNSVHPAVVTAWILSMNNKLKVAVAA